MKDLECPYCEAGNDINHDDGFGYEENVAHEMECCECEKTFTFQTHISFNYFPEKADCLNGSPHEFSEWRYLWEHEGKRTETRYCITCDHNERQILDIEEK